MRRVIEFCTCDDVTIFEYQSSNNKNCIVNVLKQASVMDQYIRRTDTPSYEAKNEGNNKKAGHFEIYSSLELDNFFHFLGRSRKTLFE